MRFSLLILLLFSVPASAQDGGRFIRWAYQDAGHLVAHEMPTVLLIGAGGAVVLGAGIQVDEDVREQVRNNFDGHEFYLSATNALGTPPALVGPIALFGFSTAIRNRRLQDASFTSLESIAYAGAIAKLLKETAGRYRPDEDEGPRKFDPFSGNSSFPSGHATIAFAMLTPLVYYYPHPVMYAVFALGVGTDMARIALDRHWFSDVVVGSGIGFLTARYLSKRHLSQAPRNSSVSIAPIISPNAAGLHVSFALGRPRSTTR